jgi:NAD(P)H-hydrate repair Nnr-like enzyme with NAD(P)H-hydrate epimerase domain
VCGEGSFGGDGFVAAVDSHTEQLRWLIFSTQANPLVQLRIEQSRLLVENNTGHLWRINLDEPLQITLQVLTNSD